MSIQIHIRITLIAALLVIGVLASSQLRASDLESTITKVALKSTVRLAFDHETLTLGDLSTITGPQADVMKSLRVHSEKSINTGHWTPIKISTLRELIDQAPTINAGSVVIAGGDLSITRRRATSNTAPLTNATTFKDSTYEGTILKDHIERWILTRLRTQASATRIKFDSRNTKLINTPTADRVVEITEIGRSAKMHIRVSIYEGDQIVSDSTIRVDVQIERSVRVATGRISRRTLIDSELSRVESRWLSPELAIADPEKSLGHESKTTIKPGEILLSSMITQPILVNRGQLVSAKSFVGQAIVTMDVRALEDGQIGDLIELESKDRKSHFTARVAGAGRVVIVQDQPQIAKQK